MRKLLSVFVLLILVLNSFADEYHVDKSKPNMVKFISDAPIEEFEGVTDKIDGYLYFENNSLTENSALYFEVDLNSLDTGIGLRNRHMCENYLETDQFPLTHFKGKITNINEKSKDKFEIIAEGDMFIHGVTKNIKVRGEMTKQDDRYEITSNFSVKLSDYNVEIPSLMFYKIDETMQLHLKFFIAKVK